MEQAIWSIGIDTSQTDHVVCTMDATGQNTGRTRVAIGLEATSVYHWPLLDFFTQTPALHPWDPTWYVLNPKVVHEFRQTFVDRAKTDRSDAALIADAIRFGRLTPVPPPDPKYVALPVLTRHRRQLAPLITPEKNRALTPVFCLWAGYGQGSPEQPFLSAVFGRASEHMLTQDTPDTVGVAQKPLAEFAVETAAIGGVAWKAPDYIARTFHPHRAYRLQPAESQARHHSLILHRETIRSLEPQRKPWDKSRVRDPQFAAFYERKYREATHHAHKLAGVLTARQVLGVVYGLLTRGQLDNPRKVMPQ